VTAQVTLSKNDPSFWETFVKTSVMVDCSKGGKAVNYNSISPGKARGDTAFFHSFVVTSCSLCNCSAPWTPCVGSFKSSETSEGTTRAGKQMPFWAQKLLSNGPSTLNLGGRSGNTADAAAILKDIAWDEFVGGYGWATETDSTGHPTCASLKGKACCGEGSPGPFGSSTPLD